MSPRRLAPDELSGLAAEFTESPANVFTMHVLRTGEGEVFVEDHRAVIVRRDGAVEELDGWGEPDAIWSIARELEGWTSVIVPMSAASRVAELARATQRLDEIFYVVPGEAPTIEHEMVRLVTPDDLPLKTVGGFAQGLDAGLIVREGALAGAFDGDVFVGASAGGAIRGETFVDVGVNVSEPYRNRGIATAAAALVMQELLARGFSPVWNTIETNIPSQRVAAKLGLREVDRRSNVIL